MSKGEVYLVLCGTFMSNPSFCEEGGWKTCFLRDVIYELSLKIFLRWLMCINLKDQLRMYYISEWVRYKFLVWVCCHSAVSEVKNSNLVRKLEDHRFESWHIRVYKERVKSTTRFLLSMHTEHHCELCGALCRSELLTVVWVFLNITISHKMVKKYNRKKITINIL